jgi:hypothetical protein
MHARAARTYLQEHISKNISPAGKAKKEGIMKFP